MHLVVLQHGVRGAPINTKYLTNLLSERLGNTGFVYNFSGNVKFATYDGIDICGERLFQGVKSAHDNLVHQGTPPTHISFIGYCLGGLIARYVAGRLFSEGYFDHVTPLNFITIATPHLGSWRQPTSAMHCPMKLPSPEALSRTGAQLYLRDATPWGPPLLCVLSHPGLNFMAALRTFKNIVTMANVRYDRTVTFCSAAMQLEEPYPLRDFERAVAVVDPAYPSIIRPRTSAEDSGEPSPDRRPLRGRFLLILLILMAVILFPLVLLMPLLSMLHGRLHSRRKTTAAGNSVLQNLYTSWGGGVSGGSVKQRPPFHGPDVPPGRPRTVDVENGLMVRVGASSNDSCYGGGTVLVTSGFVSGGAGTKGGPEDRVPLHKDHLRQQQQLFAGLPPASDKSGLQAWLVAQLATLPVRKVHVDTCNVLHAHSAIIVSNRLFLHCRDAMQYLVDQCMVWP
ncbi:hypothetical protein Vretimale_2862 [Volvox reticuliferus]|uniref:Uncharacterized protein n=1 Tax=Volvox reticuliferus TaxID=1737510 RepID=A0A8J4D790_9CHLO|nr:hypothetical protein Vretifemale_1870 [Volvox reticuliferus]GIL97120.1 hypothetical protein Vretimale_2862 [Volvox reticuliferus]